MGVKTPSLVPSPSLSPPPTPPNPRPVRVPARGWAHRGHLEGVIGASVVQVVAHAGDEEGKDLDVSGGRRGEGGKLRQAGRDKGRPRPGRGPGPGPGDGSWSYSR